MIRRVFSRALVLTAVLAALTLGQSVRAADKIAAERRLPAKVLAYFTVTNIDEMKTRWEKTSWGRFLEDKEFAEFREDVEAKIEEASLRLKRKIGLSVEDLMAVPSGEVSMGIWMEGKELEIVGLMDFGKSEDAVDKLLDKAQTALEDSGEAKRSVEEFEGIRIVSFRFPEVDNDDSPFKPSLNYCVKDTTLVVGTSKAAIKSVLARWDGDHPKKFSDNDELAYIMRKCSPRGGKPLIKWYFNPIGVVQTALSVAGQENPQVGIAAAFLPALGITKFKAMGGTMDMASEGFDSVTRTMLYVDQPPSGLLNLFLFPAMGQTPPDWVSSETESYSVANWDAQAAYSAVESLIDMFQGPGATERILDDVADNANGPGVHPKDDILDQMAGPIHTIAFPVKASEGNTPEDVANSLFPRALFAIKIKDEQKMKGVLKKLMDSGNLPVESRDFRGTTIYDIASGDENVKMGFALSKGMIMFATEIESLESALRGDTKKPLSKTAAYRRVAEFFPENTSILSFSRQDSQMKALYEMVRSGNLGEEVPGIDFGKLPEFSAMKKYLSPTGSYTIPDDNGALMMSFQLPVE